MPRRAWCRSLQTKLERLRSAVVKGPSSTAAPSGGAIPAALAIDEEIIDTLKQVSELMVYGDKHSERFFECVAIAQHCGLDRSLIPSSAWSADTSARRAC
jgi:hypothetical protein